MTNHWIDIQHSDCVLIIGSNAAENHPVSFRWVTKAVEKGAKLIHVDPRFSRTSALAHVYALLRPGTDIAFVGGLINYIIERRLYNEEYLLLHTNAAFLVKPEYRFDDGLFSGYDAAGRKYDKSSWQYQLDAEGKYVEDPTLQDPRCVFQLLKQHYSRYDVDTVCAVTGTPKEDFLRVAETFAATGARDKAGTIMYAMGATQHTVGTQNVRSYALLQTLLGNMGRAGGGINALRGESNVQGSTDHALLFDLLPGYLKVPRSEDRTLADYLTRYTPKAADPAHSVNYWSNTPKFMVSLLKAYWGDKAQKENDFCYEYLPKAGGDYSHISLFEAMYADRIKGLVLLGQNPAVGGPNARMERKALENLDWMVAVDLWETETSVFWQGPEATPASIKTEVFLLPAASSVEKEGSITNSGRWLQWRYKAVDPPGQAESDLWIIHQLHERVRDLYQKEGGAYPRPILDLAWNYGHGEEPDVHLVAKEINGRDLTTGQQLASFAALKDDGTTLSGNWIYGGSYTAAGNMAARRGKEDPTGLGLYPNWTWAWPLNRRIIYNRASCDANGEPFDPSKPLLRWTGTEWVGDVPDYGKNTLPSNGVGAFIMRPEGRACLFGPGLADGPFPEHYEPVESPVANLLSSVQNNPVIVRWATPGVDLIGSATDYPIIATTYRVSEHWQTGPMTRNLPWLVELMPSMFVEMGRELALAKGIVGGDLVRVRCARGEVRAVALVTDRVKPLQMNGRTYEQVGLPWHWGYAGLVTGDSANCLTPHVGDANTMMPEYKAFLCDIEYAGPAKVVATPTAAPPAPANVVRRHTVVAGDTLSGLAARYYGDAGSWQKIHAANAQQIADPNVLHIGQVLVIP